MSLKVGQQLFNADGASDFSGEVRASENFDLGADHIFSSASHSGTLLALVRVHSASLEHIPDKQFGLRLIGGFLEPNNRRGGSEAKQREDQDHPLVLAQNKQDILHADGAFGSV